MFKDEALEMVVFSIELSPVCATEFGIVIEGSQQRFTQNANSKDATQPRKRANQRILRHRHDPFDIASAG